MVTIILVFITLAVLLLAAIIVWTIKETWKDPGNGFLNKSDKE
jgi:hypothetical protein